MQHLRAHETVHDHAGSLCAIRITRRETERTDWIVLQVEARHIDATGATIGVVDVHTVQVAMHGIASGEQTVEGVIAEARAAALARCEALHALHTAFADIPVHEEDPAP